MTELPRWRTSDAAYAADISHKLLLSMLERCIFRLAPDDVETTGAGIAREFTRESIYRLAVTARLARAGISQRLAANLADQFSRTPPAATHAPFLIAELSANPRLLIDSPTNPTVNLIADVATIIADVEIRLRERKPV